MTQVINFFGGPGAGKSTTATGLFSFLKQKNIRCEYVSEYAKDITWEETHKLLENQVHIFSEQLRRQWRLINKVDYIITDSPLLLSSIYYNYFRKKYNRDMFSPEHSDLMVTFFDRTFGEFNNINIYIHRNKPYDPVGRNQTHVEAEEVDQYVLKKLCNEQFYETDSIKAINDSIGFLNLKRE